MNWEKLAQRLETILQTPVHVERLSLREWTERSGEERAPRTPSAEHEGRLLFLLEKKDQRVTVLGLSSEEVSEAERSLIEMNIEMYGQMDKRGVSLGLEEEDRSLQLREWLSRQLELGQLNLELPDEFSGVPSLYTSRIPILLSSDLPDSGQGSYKEAKRLLESFFEEEILLIPLQDREWVILGSDQILNAGPVEESAGESIEESLEAIGLGLHEMIATEWFGECHLSIHYPMIPAKSLVASVYQMREAVQLGRTYRVAANVHLPWDLHLERLLQLISPTEKAQFLEQILRRAEHFLDLEMMSTLEQFFELGCNVSDTAKKLYIHRNTLLYRLDKFKQETGLDVRNFNDAVLVKIALLLYKVTKRT